MGFPLPLLSGFEFQGTAVESCRLKLGCPVPLLMLYPYGQTHSFTAVLLHHLPCFSGLYFHHPLHPSVCNEGPWQHQQSTPTTWSWLNRPFCLIICCPWYPYHHHIWKPWEHQWLMDQKWDHTSSWLCWKELHFDDCERPQLEEIRIQQGLYCSEVKGCEPMSLQMKACYQLYQFWLLIYITVMCYIQSSFAVGQEVWVWLAWWLQCQCTNPKQKRGAWGVCEDTWGKMAWSTIISSYWSYKKHAPLKAYATKPWPHYHRMQTFMPGTQPQGTHTFDPASSSSQSAMQMLDSINTEEEGAEDLLGIDMPNCWCDQ